MCSVIVCKTKNSVKYLARKAYEKMRSYARGPAYSMNVKDNVERIAKATGPALVNILKGRTKDVAFLRVVLDAAQQSLVQAKIDLVEVSEEALAVTAAATDLHQQLMAIDEKAIAAASVGLSEVDARMLRYDPNMWVIRGLARDRYVKQYEETAKSASDWRIEALNRRFRVEELELFVGYVREYLPQ